MSLLSVLIVPTLLAILAYCLILLPEGYFYVGFDSTPRPPGGADPIPIPNKSKDGIYRETIKFDSNGTECEGWLYIPIKDQSLENSNGIPAIAMAHGIGSTKDMGLFRHAEKFSKNGIAVLLFDYRHFGNSLGLPRHLISPSNLVNDFHNAVSFLRSKEAHKKYNIDGNRIGLWGTSYAGGHVVVAASQDSSLRAIVSQIAYMGPLPTESKLDELKKRGINNVLIGIWGAISDLLRSKLNNIFGTKFNTLYSRLYGHENEPQVALNRWESFDGSETKWLSKHPKKRENDWRNAVCVRSILEMSSYRPLLMTPNIDSKVAVLYVKATNDKLCPTDRIDLAHEWTKNSEIFEYNESHFGMYSGEPFDKVTDRQLEFLRKHLA